MVAGRVYHWKHGWIPLDHSATKAASSKSGSPVGKDFRSMTSAQKIKAAEIMHGTGSKQHKAAQKKFGAPVVAEKGKEPPDFLATIKTNGGFTYDPKKGGLLEVGKAKGFAVAVPGTEHVVGNEDVSRDDLAKGIASVVMKYGDQIGGGAVLGGYYSEQRKKYMVELTDILPPHDREAAILEGKKRNQEGIFDLATGDYIDTGGTGDG
jgi:hypothetical protein